MSRPARPVRPRLWSCGDGAALAVLLAAWGLVLAWRTAGYGRLGEPAAVDPARVAQVAERIDPNTATAASLRRLPLIGPAKAEALIRFRRAARAAGHEPVFRCREDLMEVPGIGPAAVERGAKWLSLPPRAAPGPG